MIRPNRITPAAVRKFWGQDSVRGLMVNTVGEELWCTNSYLAMPVDLFPGLLDTFAAANLEPKPGMYLCSADGMTLTANQPPAIEPILKGGDFTTPVAPARLVGCKHDLFVKVIESDCKLFEIGGKPFGLDMQYLSWFEPYNDEILGSSSQKPVLFHRTIPVKDKPSVTRRLGVLMPVRI